MWKKLLTLLLALSLVVSLFGNSAEEVIKDLMEANLEMEACLQEWIEKYNNLQSTSKNDLLMYEEDLMRQSIVNENLKTLNKEAAQQLKKAKMRESGLIAGLVIISSFFLYREVVSR